MLVQDVLDEGQPKPQQPFDLGLLRLAAFVHIDAVPDEAGETLLLQGASREAEPGGVEVVASRGWGTLAGNTRSTRGPDLFNHLSTVRGIRAEVECVWAREADGILK